MKTVSERTSLHPIAWFALIAGGAVIGVFGGLLMYSQLASPEVRGPVEVASANAALDPQLVEALRQLAEELRASRTDRSPLETPASASSQRNVAPESGSDLSGDLAVAMRELRETIHELRLGRSAATRPALALPPADRQNWLPELPTGTENPSATYNRQHLLWSEQQVLDAYGLPDRITAEGPGISKWYYYDENLRLFQVNFQDGRVTSLDVSR